MTRANDQSEFLAQSEAQAARLQREIEEAQRKLDSLDVAWQAQLAGLKRVHQEDLRRFAFERVTAAAAQPPLPAPEVEVDKATRLARLVKRRRSIV